MAPTSPEGKPEPAFHEIRALFAKARELPPAEREAWVRREAASSPPLRDEVLELLAADVQCMDAADPLARLEASTNGGPTTFGAGDRVQWTATDELLERLLAAKRLDTERFHIEGELGQGGMGVVWRTHDQFLNRRLAMKVLRDRRTARDEDERKLTHQLLARFLEEAQVTSQLDHPGVVPVHDIGMDTAGKIYFTMRMVKGRTANEVFADALAERDGWNLTTALEVVLKVCDTMAFAHDKRVLHRDLKPTNVMIGRFGEVYVMDWGLAKVLGQKDRHEHNLRPAPRPAGSQLHTTREHDASKETGSSLVSMDGQRLGTPSYMSPEQARSQELDFRTDVYSIGAMLYELVTGRAPYTSPGIRMSPESILRELDDGPPKRIEQLRRTVPAELVAVIEKAMARERDERYPTVGALAKDLRAFLANRVVSAYRTGAWQETRLWVRRNKSLAASIAASFLAMVTGVLVAVTFAAREAEAKDRAKLESESARKSALMAQESERHARASEEQATQARRDADAKSRELADKIRDFDHLSLAVDYDKLLQDSEALVPGYPDQTNDLERWLQRADALMKKEPELRDLVERFKLGANDSASIAPGGNAFVAEALSGLLQKIPSLGTVIRKVRDRHRWSLAVGELTLNHPKSQWKWPEVRAKVASNPKYLGQRIPMADNDIWGLVPIGENPQSKLWEFYDLRSTWDGKCDPAALASLDIPRHAADGSIEIRGETGIIWVLVPGGGLPRNLVYVDRLSDLNSNVVANDYPPSDPRIKVRLDPHLVSKDELTNGQWTRVAPQHLVETGNGSDHSQSKEATWMACKETLEPLGLQLPSELQWEYFARAGASTIWWTGNDPIQAMADDSKGNPFGLKHLLTNMSEWCHDAADHWNDYGTERDGDGRRPPPSNQLVDRVLRGKSGDQPARLGQRDHGSPFGGFTHKQGLRPVRTLNRTSQDSLLPRTGYIASGSIINHTNRQLPTDIELRVRHRSRPRHGPHEPMQSHMRPDGSFSITGDTDYREFLLDVTGIEGFCPIEPIPFHPGDSNIEVHLRKGEELRLLTMRRKSIVESVAYLVAAPLHPGATRTQADWRSGFSLRNRFLRGNDMELVETIWDSVEAGVYCVEIRTKDGALILRTPDIPIRNHRHSADAITAHVDEPPHSFVSLIVPKARHAPGYVDPEGLGTEIGGRGFVVQTEPVYGEPRTTIATTLDESHGTTFSILRGSTVNMRFNGFRDACLYAVQENVTIDLDPGIETRIAASGYTIPSKGSAMYGGKIILTAIGLDDSVYATRNAGMSTMCECAATLFGDQIPRAAMDGNQAIFSLPRAGRYRIKAHLIFSYQDAYALGVEPSDITVPEEGGTFQIEIFPPK